MKNQFKKQIKDLIINQIFDRALKKTDELCNHDNYLSIQNIEFIIDCWEQEKAKNKELGRSWAGAGQMKAELDCNLKEIEHPLSSALWGLSDQKIQIIKVRNDLLRNTMWRQFQEFWDIYTKEIEKIDRQLNILYKTIEI